MAWFMRYRWLMTAIVCGLAVAVVTAVLLWPEPAPPDEPRTREYRDYDVCVLTPAQGLADPQAAAVWAGAEELSLARSVRVRYRQVTGEQSTTRAAEYLAGLVAQDCEVIVAVGAAPVAAANEAHHPGVTIVAVGHEIDGSSNETIRSSTLDTLMDLVPEG